MEKHGNNFIEKRKFHMEQKFHEKKNYAKKPLFPWKPDFQKHMNSPKDSQI